MEYRKRAETAGVDNIRVEGRMAEPTLLNEGSIQVTRRRVIVDGKTYDVGDITTVSIGNAPLPRVLLWGTVVLGALALMLSSANGNLACLGVGIVLLGIAGYAWWRGNRTYTLLLGTPQGEKRVLTSNNRQFVDRVAQTIDALLVERSRMARR